MTDTGSIPGFEDIVRNIANYVSASKQLHHAHGVLLRRSLCMIIGIGVLTCAQGKNQKSVWIDP